MHAEAALAQREAAWRVTVQQSESALEEKYNQLRVAQEEKARDQEDAMEKARRRVEEERLRVEEARVAVEKERELLVVDTLKVQEGQAQVTADKGVVMGRLSVLEDAGVRLELMEKELRVKEVEASELVRSRFFVGFCLFLFVFVCFCLFLFVFALFIDLWTDQVRFLGVGTGSGEEGAGAGGGGEGQCRAGTGSVARGEAPFGAAAGRLEGEGGDVAAEEHHGQRGGGGSKETVGRGCVALCGVV